MVRFMSVVFYRIANRFVELLQTYFPIDQAIQANDVYFIWKYVQKQGWIDQEYGPVVEDDQFEKRICLVQERSDHLEPKQFEWIYK